jgi:hypothetical protein
MRYEHLTLDLSTAACSKLEDILDSWWRAEIGSHDAADLELDNLRNELRARLQRRDQDPLAGWDLI